jgi:heptosyltransferase-2
VKRILVVRVSALGDVVLATPALRALAAAHPGAELHFVTDAGFAPLFEGLPFLTRVHRWDGGGRHIGTRGLARFAAELGEGGRFDLAVDLQNKLRTRALLALLRPAETAALVKRRGLWAVARAIAGDDPVLAGPHATELYFGPLAKYGAVPDGRGLEVEVPADAAAAAARLLGPDDGRPLVALAPGARWETKRWDPAHFAAVGNALARAGARLVLAGGPGDLHVLEAIRNALDAAPVGDTAGLDVAGLAGVLARAAVVVSCDSAPVHLAQAVGTPVVAIFGPTAPGRWGPLPGRGAALALPLPCTPCSNHGTGACPLGNHACLAELPPAVVADVALAAIRAGRDAGGAAAATRAAAHRDELAAIATRIAGAAR